MSKSALALAHAIPAAAMAAFDEVVKTMDKGETSDVPHHVDNVVELVQPTAPNVVAPSDDVRAPQSANKPAQMSQLMEASFLIGKGIGSIVKAADNVVIWAGQTVINAGNGIASLMGDGVCNVVHSIAYAYGFLKVVAEIGHKRGSRAGGKYFHTTK